MDKKEIYKVVSLVHKHFGNKEKTIKWFNEKNALLGDVSPQEMINMGRVSKLLQFVQTQLQLNEGNGPNLG